MMLRRYHEQQNEQGVTKLENVTPKPEKKEETPKATTKKRTTKG